MARPARSIVEPSRHDLRVLAALLDTVSDGVVIVDMQQVIVAVSPSAQHELGAEPGLDIDNWSSLRPVRNAAGAMFDSKYDHPLHRALRGERISHLAIKLRPKRAALPVSMHVSARPLSTNDNVQLGAVATFTLDDTASEERLATYVSKLEDSATEVGLITEMGDFLQSCLTTDEFYAVVEQYAPRIFKRESGGVYLLDASKHSVEPLADWGDEEPGAFRPQDCWALRRGRAHVVSPAHPAPRCHHVKTDHHYAYLCLPMMAQGEILGIVHVRMETEVVPTEPEFVPNFRARQATTRQVAEQISMALANLRLRDTLRNQAVRDPMTRLYNRRYMNEFLRHSTDTATAQSPLSVVMIDLDHFKRFNDTFGHAAADIVLKEVSHLLTENGPSKGIACRYGGEELTLILPEHDLQMARDVADALRLGIQDLSVVYKGDTVGQVTASMGVACSADCGADPDVLLNCADKALYRAKEDGRNQVRVWTS